MTARRGAPGGVIGMVHLLPLPGSPRHDGGLQRVLDRAAADARALQDGGADAVLVENYGDAPFFKRRVPPITIAAMTRGVSAVRAAVELPVGVNVLRNDAGAALAIAAVTGARFIRVNVHTGGMHTDQGWIEGRAAHTLRLRERVAPAVAILADVMVKHATPPAGLTIAAAARDAWHRGRADALVVSGSATGQPTSPADLQAAREAVPEATILAGSGITADSIAAVLQVADGAIVGSAFAAEGVAGSAVDTARVRKVVEAAAR